MKKTKRKLTAYEKGLLHMQRLLGKVVGDSTDFNRKRIVIPLDFFDEIEWKEFNTAYFSLCRQVNELR